MSGYLDPILSAPPWAVLGVVALVVFAEDALFVGFVLPGETAAVLGGVAASRGHVPLAAVIVVVILAAVIGDTVGFEIGRHVGTRVLALSIMDRRRAQLERARDFLARRGGSAVFLGRWTAFFRAVMPALAGTARMPYARFLAFNVAGGVLWSLAVVLVGYFAGESFGQADKYLGTGAAVVLAVLVLALVGVWLVRRHRARDRDPL